LSSSFSFSFSLKALVLLVLLLANIFINDDEDKEDEGNAPIIGCITNPGELNDTTKYASAFNTIADKKSVCSFALGNGTFAFVLFPKERRKWSKNKCNKDQMTLALVMSAPR
jgi:hypothetical protein|tara:strand:+ start:309 stop:644 length:336 start_codon:yes stop_codon:yes gene_type:complete